MAPAVVIAGTVAEVLEMGSLDGIVAVIFPEAPADAERLPAIPGWSRIDVPWSREVLPACRALGGRARIRVEAGSSRGIEALVETLRSLSREGIPTAVAGIDRLSPGEALRLADLFLHDPAVAAPIDPFAALLRAVAERRSAGLWDILAPGEDRRWRPAGDGGVPDGIAGTSGMAALPLAEVDGFLRKLPGEHPECLACDRFPLCEGYGARMGSCATWKAVTGKILSAARELAVLGRALAELEEPGEGEAVLGELAPDP